MFRHGVIGSLSAGFILLVATAAAAEEIGRLTYVQGRVDRSQISTSETYTPVVKDESVSAGDVIRTKSFSRAEIAFADRSIVRLGENTQVSFREYTFDEKGARTGALLDMERGKIRAIVSKFGADSKFDIRTANALGTIKGSDIFVSYQKSATNILSLEGDVITQGLGLAGQTVIVKPGTTALVPPGASPQAPRPFIALERTRLESETEPAAQAKEGAAHIVLGKAVVTNFSGAVRVRAKGTGSWHRPDVKEALASGDEIETGPDGNIRLVLDSGRVVDVQPGTQLKVSRIFYDPATGAHEDIFESKMGKLRVQVEKLKQGSKFEVRTPTAVAAVRGTIMYLNILPNVTTAFFQNGNGSLTNLFNNISREVAAGQNSSADDQGGVTEPSQTTPAQLDALETEWGSSGQTYGYSDPGVTPAGGTPVFENADFGLQDVDTGVETENLFDEIPTDTDTSEPTTPPVPLTFNGLWGEERRTSLYANSDGSFNHVGEDTGTLGSTVSPWEDPAPYLAAGIFIMDLDEEGNSVVGQNEPLLWDTPIFSDPSTNDGGAFSGRSAGLWKDGVLQGSAVALYLDPDGNIGVLTGNVEGAFDPAGAWSAEGMLTATSLDNRAELDPEAFGEYFRNGYMDGGIEGDFAGDGQLNGSFSSGSTSYFHFTNEDDSEESLPWGIYHLQLGNGASFSGGPLDEPANWSGVVGGQGSFDGYREDGYWIGLAGGAWQDGEIRGGLAGVYLTNTQLGILGGDFNGIFNVTGEGRGEWIAESLGVFSGVPLTFNGRWGQSDYFEYDSLYYNDEGYIEWGGEEYGLIGAVTSPWDEPSAFVAIGRYDLYYVDDDEPLLWNTALYSYSASEGSVLTHGRGAFFGFTAGIWKDGEIDGSVAALYIDDGGNAGVLTGGVLGEFFSELGMWFSSGTLTASPMSQDFGEEPSEFYEFLREGELEAYLEGEFPNFDEEEWDGDTPYLYAETNSGSTFFLHADDGQSPSEPWGIFNIMLGYENEYYNPDRSDIWIADLEGEGVFGHTYNEPSGRGNWYGAGAGSWENGEIRGKLAGIYLTENGSAGVMLGDVFGLYYEDDYEDDYGYWVGESLGTFVERAQGIDLDPEDLFWRIDDSEFESRGFGAFAGGGMIEIDQMHGVSLGLDELEWGAWVAVFLGSYEDAALSFTLAIGGIQDEEDSDDRSAWLGTVRGDVDPSSGALHGKMQAVWVSEHDDNLGFFETGKITGDVSGRLDGESGTWQAAGAGEWVEIGELEAKLVGYEIQELINFVSIPITEVHQSLLTGMGDFGGVGVINAVLDASFYGNDAAATSGLWAALVSGSFSGAPGSIETWSATLSGPSNIGEITADLEGLAWAENQWTANVSGTSVDGLEFSGQAAGSYASDGEVVDSGTFQGVGTGVWNAPVPETEPE